VRGEYRHDLNGDDPGLLMERARLGLDVERGPVEARVVLQDARVWNVPADAPDFFPGPLPLAVTSPYEAWGEAHTTSAVHPSYVRVGRQPVTWGEGRLLGTADWSPTGRTLDAVRARLVVGDGAFELLAASLEDPTLAAFTPYGQLLGARAQWAFDPLLALEAYALARFAQANPAASLEGSVRGETYTGSLRAHGDGRAWTWGVEGAYQLGRAADFVRTPPPGTAPPSAPGMDRSAWAAAGHVAYTFEHVVLVPTARLGVSYASGDGSGSTYGAFDPLLPDVHTWHGAMDVFAWSNEAEVSARLAAAPWTDAVASVEYRYARMAQSGSAWRSGYLLTIGESPGNTQADLGHEVDAALTWSPFIPVELSAGYSFLVLGDGAKAVVGANGVGVSHFAWAQAAVRMP